MTSLTKNGINILKSKPPKDANPPPQPPSQILSPSSQPSGPSQPFNPKISLINSYNY
jgi:hypothetical protein